MIGACALAILAIGAAVWIVWPNRPASAAVDGPNDSDSAIPWLIVIAAIVALCLLAYNGDLPWI